jgi:phosphoglycolate phosphatase
MQTVNKPKALLFDLDGTLANTIGDITDAVNTVMKNIGAREITETVCMRHVGNGLRRTLLGTLKEVGVVPTEPQLQQYMSIMLETYRNHPCDRTFLYHGIDRFLQKAVAGGIPLGVLSNKDEHLVQQIVNALLPDVPFVSVRGASERFPKKPDPTLAHRFIREVGCTSDLVVFIGDSEIDYHTAQAAGMQVALVTWGFRSRSELEDSKVGPLYDSVEDLESEVLSWL